MVGLGQLETQVWILRTNLKSRRRCFESYKALEPREGEPRQPNKTNDGLLRATGACWGLFLGSPCLGSNGFSD